MLTVKQLKEILNEKPDDMIVIVACQGNIGHDYQHAEVREQRIAKDPNCNYVYEDVSFDYQSLGRDVFYALLIS